MEKAIEEAGKSDSEIMEQRRILKRHKRLAGFYKQQYRYLPEFGQACRIFEEEGAGDNSLRISDVSNALENYNESSLQYPKKLHRHFKGSIEGKRCNHPYTNQTILRENFSLLS